MEKQDSGEIWADEAGREAHEAVRAVHSAFGLDAQAAEAVVYGGTGR